MSKKMKLESPELPEDLIKENREAVINLLTPTEILTTLELSEYLSSEDVQKIENTSKMEGYIAASRLLLRRLLDQNKPGWGQNFVDALQEKDDENRLILMILGGQCNYNSMRIIKKYMSLFHKKLGESLVIPDIVVQLRPSIVLSDKDIEEINAILKQCGSIAAAWKLLNGIHKRTENWFTEFLIALLKLGRMDLFFDIVGADDEEQGKWRQLDDEELVREKINSWIYEFVTQVVKDTDEYPMDNAGTVDQGAGPSTSQSIVHGGKVTIPVRPQGIAGLAVNGVPMYQGEESTLNNAVQTGIVPVADMNSLSGPDVEMMDANDFDGPSEELPEQVVNILTGPDVENVEPAPGDENEADDNGEEPMEEVIENAELKLRKYQLEVAQPAVDGKNSIVVMPTGTGKTHVALWVTKNHFESRQAHGLPRKAVFVVPVKALVHQQSAMFKNYLLEYKCEGITGSGRNDKKVPFDTLCERNDIIVLTPQILINAVERDKLISINIFTLIIIDECHHNATGNHPQRALCRLYLKENLDTNDPDKIKADRPLVLGLTASVGVGRSRSNETQIQEHILQLCGTMAVDVIQPVLENLEELNECRTVPFEEIYTVPLSTDDKFYQVIRKMMVKIENCLKQLTEIMSDKSGAANVAVVESRKKLVAIPTDWNHQRYTMWVNSLTEALNTVTDDSIRRWIFACVDELKIYNEALFLNAYCRNQDALQFIQDSKEASCGQKHQKDNMELLLDKIFQDHVQELKNIVDGNVLNKSLSKLKQVIMGYRKKVAAETEGEELRGIIFVKTREMTLALQRWMNDDAELKELNAHYFTSTNTSTDKKGLTDTDHDKVLKDFRKGVHKIIIATTVAEEGLDIQECNLVIRYHHVTNVTSRIQSKGRGRKKDAHYICIGDAMTVNQDQLNGMLEERMHRAVKNILQKTAESPDWFKQQVSRWIKDIVKENTAKYVALKREATGIKLKCHKCNIEVCDIGDVRTIRETHHAVISPGINDMCTIKPHPKPIFYDEFTQSGKVFCKKCNYLWGIVQKYCDYNFIVIQCCSFNVVESNGNLRYFKKWAGCPYKIEELKDYELSALKEQATLLQQVNVQTQGSHNNVN